MSFDPVRKLRGMGEDNSQMDVKEIEYLRFCFDSKLNVEEKQNEEENKNERISKNETPLSRRKKIYKNLKSTKWKKKGRRSFQNMLKRADSIISRRSSDTSQESNTSTVKNTINSHNKVSLLNIFFQFQ